jgi:hypothetical protein
VRIGLRREFNRRFSIVADPAVPLRFSPLAAPYRGPSRSIAAPKTLVLRRSQASPSRSARSASHPRDQAADRCNRGLNPGTQDPGPTSPPQGCFYTAKTHLGQLKHSARCLLYEGIAEVPERLGSETNVSDHGGHPSPEWWFECYNAAAERGRPVLARGNMLLYPAKSAAPVNALRPNATESRLSIAGRPAMSRKAGCRFFRELLC